MALYHKHRPDSFDKMIGNEKTLATLMADLRKEDDPHAFLLTGPTGCGKTTIGRIIAKEIGAIDTDFREVDSADFRGIDSIREIRKQSEFLPLKGPAKAWLLDECHKLTDDAQNALLKALEDPNDSTYFILATTDPQKLISTIRGRCSHYAVERLSDKEMRNLLFRVVKSEKASLKRPIYAKIIETAEGHPRNALQILDQVISAPEEDREHIAGLGFGASEEVINLCRALINFSPWKMVAGILTGLKGKENPERIRQAIMGYCVAILLKKSDGRAAQILEEFEDRPLIYSGFPGLVLSCYSVVEG